MNCNCSTDETYEDQCVMCFQKSTLPMNEYKRTQPCKQHRIIFICGPGEYVCHQCTTKGWYSTAGTGGGTYHRNHITGEENPIK